MCDIIFWRQICFNMCVASHFNGPSLFCHSNEAMFVAISSRSVNTTYWFRQQRLMDKRVRSGRSNVLRDGESRPKTYLLTYLHSAEVKTNRSCKAVWKAAATADKSESRRIDRRPFCSPTAIRSVHTPSKAFLGALAKLRKVTISFVMSVCPSVSMEQLSSHQTDFHEI